MNTIIECPKCKCQLEVKLTFASGPRTSEPTEQTSATTGRSLQQLLDGIDDDQLTGKAAEFVTQTRERFEKYGPRTKMSEKQMAWLNRIADGETGNEW